MVLMPCGILRRLGFKSNLPGLQAASAEFLLITFYRFPACRPAEDKISLWTEFVSIFSATYTAYFEEQNEKINSTPRKKNGAIPIYIDAIGVINGCTDMLSQAAFCPEIAFNRTLRKPVSDLCKISPSF